VRPVDALLADLGSRDIRLWVEDGRLRFNAPEGAMTADLRQELTRRKGELVDLLGTPPAGEKAPATAIAPDPAHAGDPFPLTNLQRAYWIGRSDPDSFELGGVSAHVYFELEGEKLDLARLEWAWNTLVKRHGMLRAVVDSYSLFEPGVMPPVGDFSEAVARTVSLSFVLGLKIAAPFVAVGLLFSLGIGVLARLMPQVQVFFIAMPLQIALGFVVLGLTLSAAMVVFTDTLSALYGDLLAGG